MVMRIEPANPKRSRGDGSDWYPYYAGYQQSFVASRLAAIRPRHPALVLDPWNGSGTTTSAAAAAGYRSIGADLNPATIPLAAGRVCFAPDGGRPPQFLSIPRHQIQQLDSRDPFLRWFEPESAAALRQYATEAAEPFVGQHEWTITPRIAAHGLAFTAVAAVVRSLLVPFVGTNPTWFPRRLPPNQPRLSVRPADLRLLLQQACDSLASRRTVIPPESMCTLVCSDSAALPLPDATAEVIVTSPPYCTRLDYPVATTPELAVLGIGQGTDSFDQLRLATLGGTRLRHSTPAADLAWGSECNTLLDAVRRHPSHASTGYYLRLLLQYFSDLAAGFREITRVAGSGATLVLVVQTSWYKELAINLPLMATDMLSALGWRLVSQDAFPVRHTLADTNPASRRYRTLRGALESALQFELVARSVG